MESQLPERNDIQPTVFNDPIHGSVVLPPLLVEIIDTPQFQRLRNIKQLGGKSYVYPGANHTRFEHSIGVAYLAGELVKSLKERQPELHITETDILCVQIAGLCHDLGHGPFSHMYDDKFVPEMQRMLNEKDKPWKHETSSVLMFDYLVTENDLNQKLRDKKLISKDLTFIKELINPETHAPRRTNWRFRGRGEEKSFLYDIVSNKRNGIDVDKWDYFARDCHYLGMKNSFDYRRLIIFARVCKWEGRREICFRDKEVSNLYDMFSTRYTLHRRACQHKVGNIIERMITDAFVKANESIEIQGSGGEICDLYTAKGNMEAYTNLTDDVFEQILNHPSDDQNMSEAKEILRRLSRRDHYKCLGEFSSRKSEDEIKEIKAEWEEELGQNIPPGGTPNVQPEDFVVDVIKLNYGRGRNDPIDYVHFYRKTNLNKAIKLKKEDVPYLLPAEFEATIIRIYGKRTNYQTLGADRQHFENFKTKHDNFP